MNPPDCFELLYYPGRCRGELDRICRYQNKQDIKDKLDEPMPWIGMYIAAASAVCGIAMAADAFNGFKTKKFWFPCKYFSLNATSLTLLAVAMKLTVDLSNVKDGFIDSFASVTSLMLMSTAIHNFMISLATMDDNGILLNLSALAILVVTIAVNVCIYSIQRSKAAIYVILDWPMFLIIAAMLLSIILLCSSAVMVPTTKRYVESKFREMHKMVSSERVEDGKFTLDELTTILKKYWVMAATGNPQFVMARCVICVIPGIISSAWLLLLVIAYIQGVLEGSFDGDFDASETSYKWSVACILFIQTVGVAIGAIAPISRWFLIALIRSSNISFKSIKNELKIETYCIRTLGDWRESPITLRIRHRKCKKVVHVSKKVLLNVCIGIQVIIILVSKLVLILSMGFIAPPFMLFHLIKKFVMCNLRPSNSMRRLELDVDFSSYVLLLEGEPKLPTKTIANICKEVHKLIRIGKTQRPKKIIELLRNSKTFNGVREFESNEVAISRFQGPPNCWSLVVVTLIKIAISLPNIPNHSVDQLLSEVSEGFSFVKLIEKIFEANWKSMNIRKAADVVWVKLELYHNQTQKQKLQDLSKTAEKEVVDFKASSTKDLVMKNPINWPPEVIAANSMYKISQTLLLTENQSDQQIFERVSTIVSDILAACLTNLAHVILTMCQSTAIEKREESIRQAALLLGKSEEVIQFLEQREWPSLDPEKAGFIEAWRVILEQDAKNPVTFSPAATDSDLIPETSSSSNGDDVSVEIGS